ncbi:Elongator subunit elp4 [Halocaridina rubra]|uniref:Elongator complex protein 4 n=1 Tax=Halocaridina rubra TaxID=373956 RepID=A0AAN8WTP9_HALRR
MTSVGSVSSFQKKGKSKSISIPGTRPSIHNSQLLTSTGIPSLDYLLGGGLPVGSILLVEEDRYDVYSKLFLKYFLAEGVMNKHMLTVASLDISPQSITETLPAPVDVEPNETSESFANNPMTIAWRYQNQKSQPTSFGSNRFSHNYDLTKVMAREQTFEANIESWRINSNESLRNSYWQLLEAIKKRIETGNMSTLDGSPKTNVLRLGLHSIGSPLWGLEYGFYEKDHKWKNLTTFFYVLRALVRTCYSVCLVTVPSHLFVDPALILRLQSMADFVVRLESFQGSDKETNPVFKDYHGLFHVVKLAAINSLVPPLLDSVDWVFKLRRHKLTVEKLHLPPDLSDTVSRNQEDPVRSKTGPTCMGDKLPKHLDF